MSAEQINRHQNAEYAKFVAGETLPASLQQMTDLHAEITRYQGEVSSIQDEIEKAHSEYLAKTAPMRERASALRFLIKSKQKSLKAASADCGMKIEELLVGQF